jgi:hypothetical protein
MDFKSLTYFQKSLNEKSRLLHSATPFLIFEVSFLDDFSRRGMFQTHELVLWTSRAFDES